jgi:hypothetical protein
MIMATKKNAGYKVDFVEKTLTITKEFDDKAQDPASKEFGILMNLQNSIPGLTVIRKTHATPRKYTNKQVVQQVLKTQVTPLMMKQNSIKANHF